MDLSPRGFSDLNSNEMFSGKSRNRFSTMTHSRMGYVSVRNWVACAMKKSTIESPLSRL
jgi:hypothetical protein